MEKRISIFSDGEIDELECRVNEYLESHEGFLHDVVFQAVVTERYEEYFAILVHTPKREK